LRKDPVTKLAIIKLSKWGIHSGIGVSLINSEIAIDGGQSIESFGFIDNEGDPFDLKTSFGNYKETQQAIMLNIPVMAVFARPHFYVMGGFKFGIPIVGTYSSRAAGFTNRAWYPDYKVWFEKQTFAGYGDFRDKNYSGKIDLNVSVMLALETGLKWRIGKRKYIYTGIYFDYGLNNVNKSKNAPKPFIIYDNSNPENFTSNSILSSQPDKANIMAFGIKVRYAIRKEK
jgi:hypothetical protein